MYKVTYHSFIFNITFRFLQIYFICKKGVEVLIYFVVLSILAWSLRPFDIVKKKQFELDEALSRVRNGFSSERRATLLNGIAVTAGKSAKPEDTYFKRLPSVSVPPRRYQELSNVFQL